MKNKLKKLWDYCQILNFIRQVLVVICGIVITIGAGKIIEKNKINSQIRVTLGLVKDELIDLDSKIDLMIETVKRNQEGYQFLINNANNINKLPKDTVRYYIHEATYTAFISISRNAMEALKNTAQYEEIDNDLVFEIVNTYQALSVVQNIWDNYFSDTDKMVVEFDSSAPFGGWGDISNEKLLQIMSNVNVFKNRCNSPIYTVKPLLIAQGYKEHLQKRIKLLDKVLKNNNFTNVERLDITQEEVNFKEPVDENAPEKGK